MYKKQTDPRAKQRDIYTKLPARLHQMILQQQQSRKPDSEKNDETPLFTGTIEDRPDL